MIKNFKLSSDADVSYPETPMSTTPIPQDSPLMDADGKHLFMQGVGTLLYLAIQSRPDILYPFPEKVDQLAELTKKSANWSTKRLAMSCSNQRC